MSEHGEIYTTGKNFTLPPAVTGGTKLTSGPWSDKNAYLQCQLKDDIA